MYTLCVCASNFPFFRLQLISIHRGRSCSYENQFLVFSLLSRNWKHISERIVNERVLPNVSQCHREAKIMRNFSHLSFRLQQLISHQLRRSTRATKGMWWDIPIGNRLTFYLRQIILSEVCYFSELWGPRFLKSSQMILVKNQNNPVEVHQIL